jgi:gliding motility-associated-like protein
MKFFFSLIFFVLSMLWFTGTHAQDWLWARGNTGGGMDGWAVATDPAGNVFAAGIAWGIGPTVFGSYSIPFSPSGGYQSIIVKYDALGNVLWAKGTQNASTYLMNVATDRAGNAFMFGSFNSPSLQIGSFTLTNANAPTPQYFLVKFDPSGNVVWAKNDGSAIGTFLFAGTSWVLSTGGVCTDLAGNVYITTSFKVPSITVGTFTLTNADPSGNTYDVLLAKYDPSGNVIWATSAGGTKDDETYGITVTPAGDIYIAGDIWSPSLAFGTSIINNVSGAEIGFIARYNSAGAPAWASGSGTYSGISAVGLASDANNNVYLTGGFKSSSISYGGTAITNPNSRSSSLYLIKFDPSNNVTWNKIIYSAGLDRTWGYSIAMSQCGTIWVSGAATDSVNIDGHSLRMPKDAPDPIFIAGYSTAGSYVGSAALPSGGDDQNGIACDALGNLYLCSDYNGAPFIVAGDTLKHEPGSGEQLYVAKYPSLAKEGQHFQKREPTLCLDGTAVMTAPASYEKYIWNDGRTGPTHNITDTGVFWVYGFDSCAASVTDTFKVSASCNCNKALFMPNAFTPNGDGQDDVFFPRSGPGIDKIRSFRVYNRWGELLFDRENILPNDASNAWDGTFKGEKPLPDVFVWVVDAVCENGTVINKKGSVTIIR